MAWRPDHFVTGVTYMPAEVGPWLWHEFSAERTRRDLRRVRAARFGVVRVPLAWDAFVPTPRQVDRHRLRDVETFLGIAAECDLQVVPVLFAQTVGDAVLLPRYAVARGERRRGVRVISDGIVEKGAARDLWDDPLMLEVEVMWLEEMLRAFANHPALLAWDLGNDPATVCRPVRIAHVEAWARLMGGRVRATQDPCWLTLGADDVLTARGMRLGVVAPHLDALGLTSAHDDPPWVAFLLRLAQRLAESDTPLYAVSSIAAGSGDLLERLPEDGAVAALAAQWCDLGERPAAELPDLATAGIAEADGELKPHGEVWAGFARRDRAAGRPAPWPAEGLDPVQWYENLPDASNDLFARFRTDFGVSRE